MRNAQRVCDSVRVHGRCVICRSKVSAGALDEGTRAMLLCMHVCVCVRARAYMQGNLSCTGGCAHHIKLCREGGRPPYPVRPQRSWRQWGPGRGGILT